MRWLPMVLLGVLMMLQVSLWLGPNGVSENQAVAKKVAQQEIENSQLKQRNDALQAQVLDLQEGNAAIEEVAREKLGLIKPGEVFILMPAPQ